MRKFFPQLFRLSTLLPVLFFSGCAPAQHSAEEKYFLIATNIKLPYWQAAAAGLSASASRLGVKSELAGPDTFDPKAQHEEFLRVLKGKPAGILVSSADPKMMQGDIDSAVAQGIPVITMDSDVENSNRLLFIGTDNYKAGTMGAELVAKQLNNSGNVVVFTIPTQANLAQRLHGYQDSFATHPKIKISQIVDIQGSPSVAFDATKSILEKGSGKIDAFVCLEAIACPEVADVLNRQHVTNKTVVAMDTDPRTLEWIQKGGILATIGQKPFTMASYGVKMLDDLHHAKSAVNTTQARGPFSPVPAFVDTGATLIDKSNVDSYLKQLEAQTKGGS